MKNRLRLIVILVFLVSSSLILPSYSQEQKQFQVITKSDFPESLVLGETADFKIQVTNKGPFSWVKNMEPKFEIVPTQAEPYVEIKTDEDFSQYTVWKNHINTLQGTIHISEDSPFDVVFLSVSFDGTIRLDEQVTSVDSDSNISLKIDHKQQEIADESIFHAGDVDWMSRCYMIGSEITVRIVDSDMNLYPQIREEVHITIWSDVDDRKITYVATETNTNTGIFDAKVFFSITDSSPGKRIVVIDDSIVHAKYVDYNFPDSHRAVDVTDTFVMSGLDILEKDHRGIPTKITYDSCALVLLERNKEKFNEFDVVYPAPLKQIKSGLFTNEVKCKEGLELTYRNLENSPLCVKPETVSKLVERGVITMPDTEKNGTSEQSQQSIVIIPQGAVIEGNENLIPKVITVVLGMNNTVTWINQDDTAHGITSDDSLWGSHGVLKPGDSFSVTFNNTGIYGYHGQPHPWQTGTVIVLEK